jgi:hypothetical protein
MAKKKDILERQFDELEEKLKKLNNYSEQFSNYYKLGKSKIGMARSNFIDGSHYIDRGLVILRRYLEDPKVQSYSKKIKELMCKIEKIKYHLNQINKIMLRSDEIADIFLEVIYEQVIRKALIINDQANKRFDYKFQNGLWAEFMEKFEHKIWNSK